MSIWSRAKDKQDSMVLEALRQRSELLDNSCGVGLWEAVLHQGDAMHPRSLWTWSAEFRRLVGYTSEADFPNVVQSWSDRLHPDDVAPTFAAFGGHLAGCGKAARNRCFTVIGRDADRHFVPANWNFAVFYSEIPVSVQTPPIAKPRHPATWAVAPSCRPLHSA